MMKMRLILFLLIISCQITNAQSFRYEAKVDAVDSTGFYKIELNPQIISRLTESHSDLRLVDYEQKQVPYIKPPSIWDCVVRPYIVPYTILERKIFTDSISYIIIHNDNKATISSFNLQITNADVSKQFRISGCNNYKKGADKINWFAVKNAVNLNEFRNNKDVTTIKQIDFPASNYEYYKIEMNDRDSKPLNVLNCLHEEWLEESKKFAIVNPRRITISDSAKTKTTWMEVLFDQPYELDQMIFQVQSPKYFHRTISSHKRENNSDLTYEWPIETGDSVLELQNLRSKRLLFSIQNEDNLPLTFSSIRFYCRRAFIVAYLEKSKSYYLKFGNDSIGLPTYDLKYFEKLIPHQLTALKVGGIHEIKNVDASPAEKHYTFFTDKKFIWIIVGLIIVFVGLITFRMLRE